jgi:hypothetical protein
MVSFSRLDAGADGRIVRGERALHRCAVDTGNEVHAQAGAGNGAQRTGYQARAQVGAAEADTDDVGDIARFELRDQATHALAHLAGGGEGVARGGGLRQVAAQRRVQRHAVFVDVDDPAIEQAAERGGERLGSASAAGAAWS